MRKSVIAGVPHTSQIMTYTTCTEGSYVYIEQERLYLCLKDVKTGYWYNIYSRVWVNTLVVYFPENMNHFLERYIAPLPINRLVIEHRRPNLELVKITNLDFTPVATLDI